ncbi:hypothetical protein K2X33_14195, partial [bacterium]|nr:hypothetical protein [bacterium]
DTVLENYRVRGQGRLGDLVQQALASYVQEASVPLTKDRAQWTYFNFTFLGDPLMDLPVRPAQKERVSPIATATQDVEPGFAGRFYPSLPWDPSGMVSRLVNAAVPVRARVFSQAMDSGLVEETLLSDSVLPGGESTLKWPDANGKQTFFVRLENTQGVPAERQIWFRTR